MVLGPFYRAAGRVIAEHLASRGWTRPRTNLTIAWRKLGHGDAAAAISFLERYVASVAGQPTWQAVHAQRGNRSPGPWLLAAARVQQANQRKMDELLPLIEAIHMELRLMLRENSSAASALWQRLKETCLAVGVIVTTDSVLTADQCLDRVTSRMTWLERLIFTFTGETPARFWDDYDYGRTT